MSNRTSTKPKRPRDSPFSATAQSIVSRPPPDTLLSRNGSLHQAPPPRRSPRGQNDPTEQGTPPGPYNAPNENAIQQGVWRNVRYSASNQEASQNTPVDLVEYNQARELSQQKRSQLWETSKSQNQASQRQIRPGPPLSHSSHNHLYSASQHHPSIASSQPLPPAQQHTQHPQHPQSQPQPQPQPQQQQLTKSLMLEMRLKQSQAVGPRHGQSDAHQFHDLEAGSQSYGISKSVPNRNMAYTTPTESSGIGPSVQVPPDGSTAPQSGSANGYGRTGMEFEAPFVGLGNDGRREGRITNSEQLPVAPGQSRTSLLTHNLAKQRDWSTTNSAVDNQSIDPSLLNNQWAGYVGDTVGYMNLRPANAGNNLIPKQQLLRRENNDLKISSYDYSLPNPTDYTRTPAPTTPAPSNPSTPATLLTRFNPAFSNQSSPRQPRAINSLAFGRRSSRPSLLTPPQSRAASAASSRGQTPASYGNSPLNPSSPASFHSYPHIFTMSPADTPPPSRPDSIALLDTIKENNDFSSTGTINPANLGDNFASLAPVDEDLSYDQSYDYSDLIRNLPSEFNQANILGNGVNPSTDNINHFNSYQDFAPSYTASTATKDSQAESDSNVTLNSAAQESTIRTFMDPALATTGKSSPNSATTDSAFRSSRVQGPARPSPPGPQILPKHSAPSYPPPEVIPTHTNAHRKPISFSSKPPNNNLNSIQFSAPASPKVTKHSDSKPEASNSAPRFPCPRADCSKDFSRLTDMKRHMKSVHNNITVPCKLCGHVFYSGRVDNFKNHLENNCPEKDQIENGEVSMQELIDAWMRAFDGKEEVEGNGESGG